MLTADLLVLFAFLSPVVMLHDQVSLLTVSPTNSSSESTVYLGVLGSCSRTSGTSNCTNATLTPTYDLSALPDDAPTLLLTAPSASTPAFVVISLTFSAVFLFTFTSISFRHKMGKPGSVLERPAIQNFSAWIGFLGFFTGLTCFLILRMWFGKAVDDFNNTITYMGDGAPAVSASVGNAFVMVWVAYAFHSVPIISSLTKLNVQST
ncbi:hypothetical protein FISHEDRAFT_34614 [Fistulina hepatica ATCC 64428]|uniref:Uncharacterized protein n=1 Tax=Fistulina hepatica ATCC 64428 TaxID=1128425 RepID=A0A0D7AN86_9AGAR|nr:hypothetical protein FISHEDRAFT_34614 [Fistulina hepatica ATCC 64428]